MRILISLPIKNPYHESIDSILEGSEGCSGTDGSFIRVAKLLKDYGEDIVLSAETQIKSTHFACIDHRKVNPEHFDVIVAHQSHWNNGILSFGNTNLTKTYLWLHNQTSWMFVHSFLEGGGKQIICPSIYHANIYRALPKWKQGVKVIYNPYCQIFAEDIYEPQNQLLFSGAITPHKGFDKLMHMWSHLIASGVDLKLTITGGIDLHKGGYVTTGRLGVAEAEFEAKFIVPWLNSLPEKYRPRFTGILSPSELCHEINNSLAVIVNPACDHPETFCVAAVEAQACNRSVFSVVAGGLTETVYQGKRLTLSKDCNPTALAKLIVESLSSANLLKENGKLAGQYVRSKFSDEAILGLWLLLLSNQSTTSKLPIRWSSSRDLICDLLRWSKTGVLFAKYLLNRSS